MMVKKLALGEGALSYLKVNDSDPPEVNSSVPNRPSWMTMIKMKATTAMNRKEYRYDVQLLQLPHVTDGQQHY